MLRVRPKSAIFSTLSSATSTFLAARSRCMHCTQPSCGVTSGGGGRGSRCPRAQHARGANIGATALWDQWVASPPTMEIVGTECIWSPPIFATGCRFRRSLWEAQCSTDLLAEFKGEGKKSREEDGWSNNGRRGRDGGGKGRDPPHPISPLTSLPWLRLLGQNSLTNNILLPLLLLLLLLLLFFRGKKKLRYAM